MSKLRDELNEINTGMSNNAGFRNNPDNIAKEVEGTFEDILFQLESIAEMDAVSFNTSKRIHKAVVTLRKLGNDVVKDIKGGKK